MLEVDLLTTFAQLGLATAGFSGVVAALSSQSSPLQQIDRLRIRVLFGASSFVVFFSLLPVGLSVAGVPDPLRWSLASSLYLLGYVPAIAMVWRNRKLSDERPRTLVRAFIRSQLVVNLILLAANAAILTTVWPYLLALGIQLVLALVIFSMLLFDSLPGENG